MHTLLRIAVTTERVTRNFDTYVGASCRCHSPLADSNCLTWIANHNIALTLVRQLTGGQRISQPCGGTPTQLTVLHFVS